MKLHSLSAASVLLVLLFADIFNVSNGFPASGEEGIEGKTTPEPEVTTDPNFFETLIDQNLGDAREDFKKFIKCQEDCEKSCKGKPNDIVCSVTGDVGKCELECKTENKCDTSESFQKLHDGPCIKNGTLIFPELRF